MAKPKTQTQIEEISEQPQAVETMEQVEEVSPEDLAELDKQLTKPIETNTATASAAIAAQATQSKLRTIQEIEADLKKPIPDRFIKQLKAGPARGAKYVPWVVVQRILSYYAPGWSTHSIGFSTPVGTAVITELTIPTATGPVTRAGHGFEPHQTTNRTGEVKDTGFGGAPVVASAQAFKRSAVAYGLGRDLYPV